MYNLNKTGITASPTSPLAMEPDQHRTAGNHMDTVRHLI
jgi:hypothetical protein